MINKICRKFHTLKPLTQFNRHRGYKDGRRNYCKECDRVGQARVRLLRKKEKAEYDRQRWLLNKESRQLAHRKWRENNRVYRQAYLLNRYYKKKAQSDGTVPDNICELLFEEQRGLCFYCQKKLDKSHIEHKLPISLGGFHSRSNICLSCPSCNSRKGVRTAEEFLKELENGV